MGWRIWYYSLQPVIECIVVYKQNKKQGYLIKLFVGGGNTPSLPPPKKNKTKIIHGRHFLVTTSVRHSCVLFFTYFVLMPYVTDGWKERDAVIITRRYINARSVLQPSELHIYI